MSTSRRNSLGKNLQLFGGKASGDKYVTTYVASRVVGVSQDFYTTGSRVGGNPSGSVTAESANREGAKAFMITTDFAGEAYLHSYYGSGPAITASVLTTGQIYPIALSRVDATSLVGGQIILLY